MKNIIVVMVFVMVCGLVSADFVDDIGMEFVTIGNAGNAADTTGYGAVGYNYSIGKYEVTNAQWNTFVSEAGAPTGNPSNAYDESAAYGIQQPTNHVSWYEAAQFCNYLTSGDKSQGAYQFDNGDFTGIDRDSAISTYGTAYVIPTEDEWYKAAYCKPDDSGYSTYANGLDTIPVADNGWNYIGGSYSSPWNVGTGAEEQNGTFDMMGNVWEWNETWIPHTYRGVRGGAYDLVNSTLSSSYRATDIPNVEGEYLGFRIASVPEPATLVLLGLGGLVLRKRKA